LELETTWVRDVSSADADAYDAFVDGARGGAYAQARAWAPVATVGRPLSPRFFLARAGGRVVGAALVLRPKAGPVPLPVVLVERGPVVDDPDELPRVLSALVSEARRHGVARVQVMPYWAGESAARVERSLAELRFRSVQEMDGAHCVTLRLAIGGKRDEEILAGKEREALRRKLRQAEKAGAVARRGTLEDVPKLEALYGELMKGQGRGTKPRAWFEALAANILSKEKRGALFVCMHDAEPIAALFGARHGTVATFVLGATSGAARAFSKMALPMMAAVRWARDEGCEIFDLGGIPMDGDRDEKRAQIAQFKFDFAKERVPLVREHVRWL
jgi:lipid II:glycine glycyltransferase (peptidoglycan interpeptide bridge formation enzyme)